MKCVMIDTETLATVPHAVMVSVACLEFQLTLDQPVFGDFGDFVCDMESQYVEHGRVVDQATLEWWNDPRQAEAKKSWHRKRASSADEIASWLKERVRSNVYPWAHGSDFDFPILYSFLRDYGLTVPWIYNQVRDSRTIEKTLPVIRPKPEGLEFVKHDPLDDCKRQVWSLWERMPADSEVFK